MKKLFLLFIILSSCSTPNSRSDAYYEAVAGHIAQTVLSGECNSKCISSIVNSDLKYATYTQAINVIDKGFYLDAFDKLHNDILDKTDGCNGIGEPYAKHSQPFLYSKSLSPF